MSVAHSKATQTFAKCIATFFGSGLVPKAPGTAGSLAALPMWYGLSFLHPAWSILTFTILLILGVWASKVVEHVSGKSDNQTIVIDEVLGMGIACAAATTPSLFWLAFALFRVFDMVKVWPVNFVDRASKKHFNAWVRAFGVTADDLLAGIQAYLVLTVWIKFL